MFTKETIISTGVPGLDELLRGGITFPQGKNFSEKALIESRISHSHQKNLMRLHLRMIMMK